MLGSLFQLKRHPNRSGRIFSKEFFSVDSSIRIGMLILGAFVLLTTFIQAAQPEIKIISPMDSDPIIAYEEVEIFGELKNADKLLVNNYNVELQDGLFRLKFRFSETGSREFHFFARNEDGKAEKKLKVISLLTYPDVKKHKYKKEIEILATMGKFPSYFGTDFFMPDAYITKAELTRILILLKGIDPTTPYANTFHFQDLLTTHWAYPYIQLALNNNIIYPANALEFAPNRIITREELIIALKSIYGFQKEEKKAFYSDLLQDRSDHRFISYLASKGYFPKEWIKTDKFYPNKAVTRGEFAYIITRLDLMQEEIKEGYSMDLRRYAKTPLIEIPSNMFMVAFKEITKDVYIVECNPEKEKDTLFIEFQFKPEIGKDELILLVDDGEGVDLIKGDHVFSGVIDFGPTSNDKYNYLYKCFDEYNLIYKVGNGNLKYEDGKISVF